MDADGADGRSDGIAVGHLPGAAHGGGCADYGPAEYAHTPPAVYPWRRHDGDGLQHPNGQRSVCQPNPHSPKREPDSHTQPRRHRHPNRHGKCYPDQPAIAHPNRHDDDDGLRNTKPHGHSHVGAANWHPHTNSPAPNAHPKSAHGNPNPDAPDRNTNVQPARAEHPYANPNCPGDRNPNGPAGYGDPHNRASNGNVHPHVQRCATHGDRHDGPTDVD